jgi:hypothetical protein
MFNADPNGFGLPAYGHPVESVEHVHTVPDVRRTRQPSQKEIEARLQGQVARPGCDKTLVRLQKTARLRARLQESARLRTEHHFTT